MNFFRSILARMPESTQINIKQRYYRYLIRNNKFIAPEPEFYELHKFIQEGDWVIDIGANIGYYTNRLSELVGRLGRVIAFEPVPTTFINLAENSLYFRYKNTTLINAACSNDTASCSISIPTHKNGSRNYYQARIVADDNAADITALTIPVDHLGLKHRISLIKIDAEGHEPSIVAGLNNILERDMPILIIETVTDDVYEQLMRLGYEDNSYQNSPNKLFSPKGA